MGQDCVGVGVGAVVLVDSSPSRFVVGWVGRNASGLIVLGLGCGHQLHAEAAGFALQAGEVALLPALLKFHGTAVDPNLPVGNQPIV